MKKPGEKYSNGKHCMLGNVANLCWKASVAKPLITPHVRGFVLLWVRLVDCSKNAKFITLFSTFSIRLPASIWPSRLDCWSLWQRSQICYWLLWCRRSWYPWPFVRCFGCTSSIGFSWSSLGSYESSLVALEICWTWGPNANAPQKRTNQFLKIFKFSLYLCLNLISK